MHSTKLRSNVYSVSKINEFMLVDSICILFDYKINRGLSPTIINFKRGELNK